MIGEPLPVLRGPAVREGEAEIRLDRRRAAEREADALEDADAAIEVRRRSEVRRRASCHVEADALALIREPAVVPGLRRRRGRRGRRWWWSRGGRLGRGRKALDHFAVTADRVRSVCARRVCTATAAEPVLPRTADNQVVPAAADQRVVAGISVELVVAGLAVDRVRAPRPLRTSFLGVPLTVLTVLAETPPTRAPVRTRTVAMRASLPMSLLCVGRAAFLPVAHTCECLAGS